MIPTGTALCDTGLQVSLRPHAKATVHTLLPLLHNLGWLAPIFLSCCPLWLCILRLLDLHPQELVIFLLDGASPFKVP